MYGQAAALCFGDGLGMDGTGITIEHDVGDRLFVDQSAESGSPCVYGVAVGDVAFRMAPERAVTCVKADAPHLGPGQLQHFAQPVKKGSMWPLQEQKDPAVCRRCCHHAHLICLLWLRVNAKYARIAFKLSRAVDLPVYGRKVNSELSI